jgi:hypothetical protein
MSALDDLKTAVAAAVAKAQESKAVADALLAEQVAHAQTKEALGNAQGVIAQHEADMASLAASLTATVGS